jgi:hypothetical protein
MMLKIFGDFETFYSQAYTLRNMTPIEYIKHPLYETIGCGVAIGDKAPVWLEGDKIAALLRRVKEPYMFVSHNSLFDACILAFRYGVHPPLCVDTMAMSRALLMPSLPGGRVSLDNVGKHLGVGEKGHEIVSALGKNLEWFRANPEAYKRYQEYCLNDVTICREIYRQLSPQFPASEHAINDMVIKMATKPQFAVDYFKLLDHKAEVVASKQMLLAAIAADKDDLMSNDKFAEKLQALGVDPPRKVSLTTKQETWAFAKSDPAFTDLLEHDDPEVQGLVSARLGVKSTLEETRTSRFISIADATFDGKNSWMPIPLRYSGAHTHRFSGDWKLNLQNLPSRKSTALRESLKAPDGYVVLTVDAAQIEARLTAWLASQQDLVAQFANGEDTYSLFASEVYGYTVTKKTHPRERFLGKTSILGLGFGMGAPKFYRTVQIQAADNNIVIEFSVDDAERVVALYRRKYHNIGKTWRFLDLMLGRMRAGDAAGVTFGPCVFENDAILLPSGLRLFYHDLRRGDGEWSYQYGRARKYIYGAKMLENIVQALDRVHVMEAALRIKRRTREALGQALQLAHQIHDELAYVVREEDAEIVKPILLEEMARRPKWGPDLPLAAEAGQGPNFGKAK